MYKLTMQFWFDTIEETQAARALLDGGPMILPGRYATESKIEEEVSDEAPRPLP